MLRSLGAATVVAAVCAAPPAAAQTSISELVLYGVDADTHELLRYEFNTDTFVRIGVVRDQNGNVVTDIEALAHIPSGIYKGLYAAANYYEAEPSRLVRINPIDASATRLPSPIGFGKVEGMVGLRGTMSAPINNFAIVGGLVDPVPSFSVKVTVLGASLQSTTWGYDYQVGAQIVIGTDPNNPASRFDPWGPFDQAIAGNLNDGNNPRTWIAPGVYGPGTVVGVRGRSWNLKDPGDNDGSLESHWEQYTTRNSWEGSDRIYVLRDGDPVPDVAGFDDQPSVVDFLESYLDMTTDPFTMNLAPNQAVFLFELGKRPVGHPSGACDYQDLVVLVELAEDPTYFYGGFQLLAASRYSCPVNASGNYPGDQGSCLLVIDPQSGAGTALSIGTKRYQGLAVAHDGTIFGTTRSPSALWTIQPNPSNVYDHVETSWPLSGFQKCEALEFAFGDVGPAIRTEPHAPDTWALNGALFGFDDDTDSFLIINPADGDTRVYDCAFKTIDCEGLVFLTQQTDSYGQITVRAHD